MISILSWCFSRQKMLNHTLPGWLKQEDVDFEVILGIGPDINISDAICNPIGGKVHKVQTPDLKMGKSYNAMLKAAHGDMLLITQSDMEINSHTQLKRMLDIWEPGVMVNEVFMKEGKRFAPPVFLQCMLVEKALVEKAGAWDEFYDDGYAYEDSSLVSRMLEAGGRFKFITTTEEEGVYHIDHPKPLITDQAVNDRLMRNKAYYHAHHKESIMELYAKGILHKL
jgi:hypothetical protein